MRCWINLVQKEDTEEEGGVSRKDGRLNGRNTNNYRLGKSKDSIAVTTIVIRRKDDDDGDYDEGEEEFKRLEQGYTRPKVLQLYLHTCQHAWLCTPYDPITQSIQQRRQYTQKTATRYRYKSNKNTKRRKTLHLSRLNTSNGGSRLILVSDDDNGKFFSQDKIR